MESHIPSPAGRSVQRFYNNSMKRIVHAAVSYEIMQEKVKKIFFCEISENYKHNQPKHLAKIYLEKIKS